MKKFKINQILLILLIFTLIACGKKGFPTANLSEDVFTWLNIGATFTNAPINQEEQLRYIMEGIALDNTMLEYDIAKSIQKEYIDTSCLTVFGQIQGNVQNVNTIRLEVQGLTDDCKNCSFIPEMSRTYINDELASIINYDTQTFEMNYCPTTTYDEYRWRLVGINKVSGIPQVVSQVVITQ